MYIISAIAAQSTNCMLLHAYSCIQLRFSAVRAQKLHIVLVTKILLYLNELTK